MNILPIALTLLFTPPVDEQVQIHITRQIAEQGRQEVTATTYTPSGAVVPCRCEYGSPRHEIHHILPQEVGDYRLEIDSLFDPASISVQIFVIPKLEIDKLEVRYFAQTNQPYTVERTYRLGEGERWKYADRRRREEVWNEPGWKSFPVDSVREQIHYRVKVGR